MLNRYVDDLAKELRKRLSLLESQLVPTVADSDLGCMAPPLQKAVEGQTEVWSYASGNALSPFRIVCSVEPH